MTSKTIYGALDAGRPPSGADLVDKLERRLEDERKGGAPTLSRELCQVALSTIKEDRNAGRLDFSGWRALSDRVRTLQEYLIDNDRY